MKLVDLYNERLAADVDIVARAKVKKLIGMRSYPAFVSTLQSLIKDPAVLDLLKSGRFDGSVSDEQVSVSPTAIQCSKLKPTQNEIDINKSLDFVLSGRASVHSMLMNGTITIARPIITFDNKYVIDGHHRWSQLYCFNPQAKISALNISGGNIKNWKEALKAVQIAIAVDKGSVPVKSSKGSNLFTANKQGLIKYVIVNIKDGITQQFLNSDKFRLWFERHSVYPDFNDISLEDARGEIGKFIWQNIEVLQRKSRPPSGASPRGYMPQTDVSPSFEAEFGQGNINYKEPITTGEWIMKFKGIRNIKESYGDD